MEKKLLLIYNPVSGKAQIKTYLADIIDIYSNKNYEVTVHPTKCKLDGFNYIKENAHNYDVLSVCGGDGMLNEAVCALMHIDEKMRPALAYLPSGSTNDFANSLKLSKNMSLVYPSSISKYLLNEWEYEYFSKENYQFCLI